MNARPQTNKISCKLIVFQTAQVVLRKTCASGGLFLLPLFGIAQNFVPNWSFEDQVSCPTAFGQVDSCQHWSVYRETPDYYNACSTNELLQVPSNLTGFQEPSTGQAYMGIWTYVVSEQYRESFGVRLISPMQMGTTYFLSFRTVKAWSDQGYGSVATNGIGIKLSTIEYSEASPVPIDNNPVVWSSTVILDTLNWTSVEGYFTADSAYEYLSISNFFDDSNTDTINTQSPSTIAYYYVDDVCISEDPNKCDIEMAVNQDIKAGIPMLIPNPTFGIVSVLGGQGAYELQMLDSSGQIRYNGIITGQLNLGHLPNGLYTAILKNKNSTFHQKIILNH